MLKMRTMQKQIISCTFRIQVLFLTYLLQIIDIKDFKSLEESVSLQI